MPLELHRMTEADIPDFVRIQSAAFRSPFARSIFPQNPAPERFQSDVEKSQKSLREDSDCHFLKVIDTELEGKIIACAKWRINEKERSEEEFEKSLGSIGEDATPAFREFFGWLTEMRRKWMGTKPFYFLHILVTHPDHHRRGAGAMLVKWGLEQADKAHLPAYLEASAEGRPLYERLGYEPMETKLFDCAMHGGEGTELNTAMIRPAR